MSVAAMDRTMVPEILDDLPADDPKAIGSRRDLRRINQLMFQASITRKLIHRCDAAHSLSVVDLGCGDGAGALAVLRRLPRLDASRTLTLVDRRPSVPQATMTALDDLGWTVRIAADDVFEWLDTSREPVDLTMANLFLHHFETPDLERLLVAIARRTDRFVATEPLRTKTALAAARGVGLIGANSVTRHDAPASVRAGFKGTELGDLWPGRGLFEGRCGLFTHGFAAEGTGA